MSEQEAFLTRWSRRKRAAEQAAPEAVPAAHEADAEQQPNQQSEPSGVAADSPIEATEPPEIDVAALPPIESITAESDIRAFLAPGVPAQLARAALRRAWAADPAIRDFVGLAENAWDFTAPDGVPGFGPLLPGDDVQRLLADVIGESKPASAATDANATQISNPGIEREPRVVRDDVEQSQVLETPGTPVAEPDQTDIAVQKETADEDRPQRLSRLHGGALPRSYQQT